MRHEAGNIHGVVELVQRIEVLRKALPVLE